MKVSIDYGDGTEPEELEVTDGSRHFHPFPDDLEEGEKPSPTVEILEEDPIPEEESEPEAEGDEEPEDGSFDPADYTVAEVQEFVAENPEEAAVVLDLEREGKNRTTLVAFLEGLLDK